MERKSRRFTSETSGVRSREFFVSGTFAPDASTKITDLDQATVGSLFTSVGRRRFRNAIPNAC